jgi:hypothetical protein
MKTNPLPILPPISAIFNMANPVSTPLEPAVQQPSQRRYESASLSPKPTAIAAPESRSLRSGSLDRLAPLPPMCLPEGCVSPGASHGVNPLLAEPATTALTPEVTVNLVNHKRARSIEDSFSNPIPSPKRLHTDTAAAPAGSSAAQVRQPLANSPQASGSQVVHNSSNIRQPEYAISPTVTPSRRSALEEKYGQISEDMPNHQLHNKLADILHEKTKLEKKLTDHKFCLRQIVPKDFQPHLQEVSQKLNELHAKYADSKSPNEQEELTLQIRQVEKQKAAYASAVIKNAPEGLDIRRTAIISRIQDKTEGIKFLSELLSKIKSIINNNEQMESL